MFFNLIRRDNGRNKGQPAEVPDAVVEQTSEPDKYWDTYASWQPRLKQMAALLTDISKNVEEEFLSVGGKLQNFSDHCDNISSLAGSIGHLIEGGGSFDAQIFHDVFERAYNEIKSCCSVISGKVCTLTELAAKIEDILILKRFLDKLSKSITIIGTMIRIETARVSKEAEFHAMITAIDDLARQIAKNTADLSSSARGVNKIISLVNSKISESNRIIHGKLDITANSMSEILEQMASMSNQAKWACQRMEGRASQISPEVGNVIIALQSHDICRQQIEHVSEALSDIALKIASMEGMQDDEKNSFGPWLTEAVGIQILQLEHAVSETTSAAQGIAGHLSRIADLAEAQQEDATMILEDEESDSDRIVQISSEMESLSDLMGEGKNTIMTTVEDISKMNNTVENMIKQVRNIEQISDNINILALNAMVKVSGIGDINSRGLGVLADEIKNLSKNTKEEIAKGSEAIGLILSNSKDLSETLSLEMNNRLGSIEEVFTQTQKAVEELLNADQIMMRSMGEITEITQSLDSEIQGVISGIRFDSTVGDGVGSIVADLKEMLTAVEATIPEGLKVDEKMLEELKSRYTIQSELEIHDSRSVDTVQEEAGGSLEFF